MRNGSEERNEFSAAILKWSGLFFSIEDKNIKSANKEEIDFINCQKKFGNFDIHREFALNLWSGRLS